MTMSETPPSKTSWPPDFEGRTFLGRAAKGLAPDDLWNGLRSGALVAQVYCIGRADFDPIGLPAAEFMNADPADVLGKFQIEVRETDRRRSVRIRRAIPVPHWLYVTKDSLAKLGTGTASTGAEQRAIADLAEILRKEPNIVKAEAKARISHHLFSAQGFEDRIWPRAREAAGLPAKAPAGRKSRS
jgi:hypothetical protein